MEVRARLDRLLPAASQSMSDLDLSRKHKTVKEKAPSSTYCGTCAKKLLLGQRTLRCELCNLHFHTVCLTARCPAAHAVRHDFFAERPAKSCDQTVSIRQGSMWRCPGSSPGGDWKAVKCALASGSLFVGMDDSATECIGLAHCRIELGEVQPNSEGRFPWIVKELPGAGSVHTMIFACDSLEDSRAWVAAANQAALKSSERLFSIDTWAKQPLVEASILAPTSANDMSDALLIRVLRGKTGLLEKAQVVDADLQTETGWCLRLIEAFHLPDNTRLGPGLVHVTVRCLSGGLELFSSSSGAVEPGHDGTSAIFLGEWLAVHNNVSNLHANAVLLFTLRHTHLTPAREASDLADDDLTSHGNVAICDEAGRLRQGLVEVPLWPGEGSRFGWNFAVAATAEQNRGFLRVWLGPPEGTLKHPVVFCSHPSGWIDQPPELWKWKEEGDTFLSAAATDQFSGSLSRSHLSRRRMAIMDANVDRNPFDSPLKEEQLLAWQTRDCHDHTSVAHALGVFDVSSACARREAVEFVQACNEAGTRLPRHMALGLLVHTRPLEIIRTFGMRHLLGWGWNKSQEGLGPLASSIFSLLAFDSHDYNSSFILLSKYLQDCPPWIQHSFFWAAYSLSQQINGLRHRFGLYLKCFLEIISKDKQESLLNDIVLVASINACARDELRRSVPLAKLVQEHHPQMLSPGPHSVPLSFGTGIGALNLARSKALPSNAAPLFLQFHGVSGNPEPPAFIFKAGDDLGSDQLMLMFAIGFNNIWKQHQVDAEIQVYGCAPTGDRVGMIEVVPGTTSLGKVQGSWKGAFKSSVISDWFKSQVSAPPFSEIQKRFRRTLSAAVVFEHVMGLGDRHCDNLLLKPDGTIFHIDFGCCLGRDYGVATAAPVTLTTQMMHVLDDEGDFIENSVKAFIAVRKYHVFLTGLLMAAMGARMPHLSKMSDVGVLFNRLNPRVVEMEAAANFRSLLEKSLSMKVQQLNDSLHLFYMKHFYKAPKTE